MSTAYSTVECPQCGNPDAWYEYRTRRGDESLFCPLCGMDHSICMVVDPEKSTPQMTWAKLDLDGQPIYKCSKKHGFGAVMLASTAGANLVYRFVRTPSARKIQREIEQIQKDPHIDPSRSYITRWEAGSGQLVLEFGQISLPVKSEHSPEPDDDAGEIPDEPDDEDVRYAPGEIPDEPDDEDIRYAHGEIWF